MGKEIAVFIGQDGLSASLDGEGSVVVFRRAGGVWIADREKSFPVCHAKGMRELRQTMGEVIGFMNGCKIFVAKSASGVSFFELEKAGCSVWEFSGTPTGFLEHVWTQEEKERETLNKQAPVNIPAPEEITPGGFFINIKDVQGNNADVTSKQVLQRFIRKGDFNTLVAICSHVPPWIELEAMRLGHAFEVVRQIENDLTIKIINKNRLK